MSPIAALLVAVGALSKVVVVAAEESAAMRTLCAMGFATCAAPEERGPAKPDSDDVEAVDPNEEYFANCHAWPPTGVPYEHRDVACDRARQNAIWAADDAEANATPPEDLIPDTVYLNLPEEKTWICPLDTVDEVPGSNVNRLVNPGGFDGTKSDRYAGALGHPTRWIVHNEATSPIVLAHVNALGLEVSAADYRTHPAYADTAVHPHGPIVLPGQVAVVEGRQGQMFVAREYKEVLPVHAMASEDGDALGHSWKSFKSVLPPTLSFLPVQSRYTTNKGVKHVLGQPGRVLMKHRMGNIYVKNQFGAICPEVMGKIEADSVDDGRRGSPKDMDPACNVLRKAFINKVGCPVDIYFAPQNKVEGYNCEKFTKHLGPLDPFVSSDIQTRDVDGHNSPLKFENTYNGHSFVARMSHDGSLVARIDVDHDIVKDCSEPQRSAAGVEVRVDERMLQGLPVNARATNATKSAYGSDDWAVVSGVNVTAAPVIAGKPLKERSDILWQNRTSIIAASAPIAS